MQYFHPEILFVPACFVAAYILMVAWDFLLKSVGALAHKVNAKSHVVA